MKYVDRIIKYLEGDMSGEEALAFHKEVEADGELNSEFREVSAAYHLIRKQLRNRDEQQFRSLLSEVMERGEKEVRMKTRPRNRYWRILVPAAASVALIASLLIVNRDQDRLLSRFFHPEDDPLVLASQLPARGSEEYGITLYREGRYRESGEHMLQILHEDPGHQIASLYYLLSFLKSDRFSDTLEFIPEIAAGRVAPMDEALAWYTALAQLKTGHGELAAEVLASLAGYENPYQKDAKKLRKLLLK